MVRFLEANRIEFEEVDITMSEEKRQWMYKNIPEDRQPAQGNPLPPQIFSDDRYCGVSSCYSCQRTVWLYALILLECMPNACWNYSIVDWLQLGR